MLLKNFLQTFELYHLTFSQELEGKEWIGSNMRDPSTKDGDVYSGESRGGARGGCPPYFLTTLRKKDGMCIVGDPGEGPGGAAPPYFLTTMRPEGWKKFFFFRPGPPLFISGSE